MASASDDGEGPASLLQGGEATPYLTHTSKVCNLNVDLTVTESTISYTVTNVGDDLSDVTLDGAPFGHHVAVTPNPLTTAAGSQTYTFNESITQATVVSVVASGFLADGQVCDATASNVIELPDTSRTFDYRN